MCFLGTGCWHWWILNLTTRRSTSTSECWAWTIRNSTKLRRGLTEPSRYCVQRPCYVLAHLCLGTVHTEITETVIFVKCCECRDFAKMPCFCRVFCQNAVVLRFHKNILFLVSIIWSLLYEFNTKIFTFPLPLLPKSVCFVTYWWNMWLWRLVLLFPLLLYHMNF